MTRVAKLSLVALVAGTIAFAGCKKKDDDNKNKKKNNNKPNAPKVQPKGKQPTPTPTPTPKAEVKGEALIAVAEKCWKAFDGEDEKAFADCYADKFKFKLVDQVAMMPGETNKAETKEDLMKLVKPYWAAVKLQSHADLVLVSGSHMAVVTRSEATNDAPMGKVPATNKTVKQLGAQYSRFNKEGKVVKDLHFFDQNTFAVQMGLAPADKTPHRPAWEKSLWEAPQRIVAKNDETEKKNLAAYNQFLADYNSGDVKKIMAHGADDVVVRHIDMPKDFTGKKEVAAFVGMFAKAFPKREMKARKPWAAGDWTVANVVFNGTNTGAAPPMIAKATNKEVKAHTLHIFRWENGKIKEALVFANGFHMFAQLYPEKVEEMKKEAAKMMGAGAPAGDKPADKAAPPAKAPAKAPMKKAPIKK